MHPTRLDPGNRRAGYPGQLTARGMYLAFYDPDGERYGLPTYPWHWAPEGLYTIRQLREKGLRPGGQDPAAQILWRRGQRVAYLYRADLAKPRRRPTINQPAAVGRALQARRICPTCRTEQSCYIPRSLGECNDCTARWSR